MEGGGEETRVAGMGGALLEGDLSRMATGTVQAFHPAYMT